MMVSKIKQLRLKKFRGATDETVIDFDEQKRMFVIFGENGTGKTTILDAIDFACNKSNDVSLAHKSVGKNKYKYLPSISASLSSLAVEIETTTKNKCMAKVGNKGDVSVNAGLPQIQILRRDTILEIITGEPKIRFEAIRNMVSYPKVKEIEDALREAQKVIKKTYDDASKAYQQEEANLKNAWQTVGDKAVDFLVWAKERSDVKGDILETEKNSWQSIRTKTESLKNSADKLSTYKTSLSSLGNDLKLKNEQLKQKIKGETEKEGLVTLLEKAKDYINGQASISACPVCENDIKKDKLVSDISNRIDQMKDLKAIQDEITSLSREKETQEGLIKTEQKTLDDLIEQIKNLFDVPQRVALNDADVILRKFDEWKTVAAEKEKQFSQLALIQRSYGTYLEKKEEAEKSEKKMGAIKKLLEELEAIRKRAIDGVLKDISAAVKTMYATVHPGEGLESVTLYLDPAKPESLEIDGPHSVPLQTYYSDSHLDTLGICVFLALSQYNRNDGIILLDDVLTSVDQQHMDRIIDMLEAEAKNFSQIIISTHYRPWRDRYRMPVQQNHTVELIELLPWTSDSGIRHTRTKFFVEEIRDLLKEKVFDRQSVSSKSGILLEHLLDEIVLKYALKVPRKPLQKYTLSELFGAIDTKMRKHLSICKGTAVPVPLQQHLDILQNTTFVRNDVGCHYSETGALLSDNDVKDFGQHVVAFAELLLCDSCGAFPKKNKSGSYWECGCKGELKLHPLTRPGGQIVEGADAEEAKA